MIHKSLNLRIPAELVITQPVDSLYRLVRFVTIRSSLLWAAGLLVLPVVAYELLQLAPQLLSETMFLMIHDWMTHGPIIASWLIIAVLLAAIMQSLALGYRHRPFLWHLGWYALAVFFTLLAWFSAMLSDSWHGINLTLAATAVLMLAAAGYLFRRTRRPLADFSEQITGE